MIDGNTYALNKNLEEEEKYNNAVENFNINIDEYLQGMEDLYFEIRRLADEYNGYDLSDYAKECVKNYLGV
jgi:type II restriction/modification system DNA methylase subunit YeeA